MVGQLQHQPLVPHLQEAAAGLAAGRLPRARGLAAPGRLRRRSVLALGITAIAASPTAMASAHWTLMSRSVTASISLPREKPLPGARLESDSFAAE